MSEDTSTRRPKPQWTSREADYWLDLFAQHQDLLCGAVLEDAGNPMSDSKSERLVGELEDAIKLAADLTDIAVLEMQARGFSRQPRIAKRRGR
jgi:hypothetical protein